MGRESMAEKEKRQMVQKSDNEFVKSRIELHCIVPFANTIIPDSRKRKQPLRTRTFPNLRTMNGLQFIDGIGTSGCLRAERFPLPVQPAFGRTRKIPLYIFNAIFIKIVDSLFLQKVVDRRFPIFTSKISSSIEKRLKIGGARARQLFHNNEQLPKGKHKERPDSQISCRAEKLM